MLYQRRLMIPFQVRIKCAHSACKEYDLCVPCFAEGQSSRDHDPATHPFSVIEQHSIPIFAEDWGADEETLLLEGAETYGLGSWADIADHIGGYRDKDEVRQHYIDTYIDSPNFPLPEHASASDRVLTDEWPRERFQARKKRRIEQRKEEAQNAPNVPPKQKPTSSVPSCHEVQGYMPGRLEFETEYLNEAEEAVQHMQFDPGDGINSRTGELDPETDLKMTVMDIYNSRLTARVERKKMIFEHQLLECRRNMAADKKRTKEERDLHNKAKPLARLMTFEDFEKFTENLELELNLRLAIAQLQDWRQMKIGEIESGKEYEAQKLARAARMMNVASFDRFPSNNRNSKPVLPEQTPSAVALLTSADLPLLPCTGLQTPPRSVTSQGTTERNGVLTNNSANQNGNTTPMPRRARYNVGSLANVVPLKFNSENAPNLHLLTSDEQEVCSVLRLTPDAYMAIKENILRESSRQGGSMKRKQVKEVARIDGTKGGKLFDFFVHNGWTAKA